MFENIRKVLDDYENTYNKLGYETYYDDLTHEEQDYINYFNMNFSKAVMKDLEWSKTDEQIAKIILATKGLSNDISVKIE